MLPQEIGLLCCAIFALVGGGAGLVSLGRHRGLSARVDTLEGDIKQSLRNLERDYGHTRELLNVVVRGHMGDKS